MHYQGIQGGTGYKGIPQLYAKRCFGEVCVEKGQFYKREEKAGRPGCSGRPVCELCMAGEQNSAGMQNAASGIRNSQTMTGSRKEKVR